MDIHEKTILSGVTPSGQFTLGHFAGAIKNWIALQDSYNCYYMIADLHAITTKQEPADLRKRTLELAASFIACGIDPEKVVLFVQSHVSAHAELAWVLNCFTGMGECSRMTQFKDKSQKHAENINVGLFAYPTLMASDILLYQADLVPVGEDQKQHLELSRNLAERFNFNYSDTFKVPEPYIPPVGARIMSLQEPTRKMSKSDANEKNIIYIADSPEIIKNKIKRAVTDSGSKITYNSNNPGIANLMTIYSVSTGKSFKEIEAQFENAGYGEFKNEVGESIANFLAPIREKYLSVASDKKYLCEILKKGAEAARYKANKTLRKVYKKVGFVDLG